MRRPGVTGLILLVQGPRGFLFFAFTDLEVAYTPDEIRQSISSKSGGVMDQGDELALKFRGCLEKAGVLSAGGSRLVVSPSMSSKDIDDASERFDAAMKMLADNL